MKHNAIDNAVESLKRQTTEKRERWERANSNPLILFPVRLLAARGNLEVFSNPNVVVPTGKGYNIRNAKGMSGILKVRDWIGEAYQLCFDILEDPWQIAYDELLAAGEEDLFLNWPDGITNFGEEYLRWEIEQVRNRPQKATDTPQLRIATFFVYILEYEDLFLRSPDKISLFGRYFTITKLLHEQWRDTTSKLLDFAVEQGTKPNAAEVIVKLTQLLERLEKTQGEMGDALITQGVTLDRIDANTRPRKPTRGDYEVTQPDAAQILTEAGYKVSARQIQNWDRYLKTKGDEGTRPPDGYKIELRAELLTFKRWAETATSHKRMKNALRQRRQRAHKTNA